GKEMDLMYLANWNGHGGRNLLYEKSPIEALNNRSELGEVLANVTSRSSADVLSGHSFLAAHVDVGGWARQTLLTRRSRHSQVGCTLQNFTGQSMLSLC